MRIVTWNVNSIRQRLLILENWLKANLCDVVLLQETKCQDDHFPREFFEDLGYNIAIFGQKTFNGVAILSKSPIEDVTCGIPEMPVDGQARYIEAVVGKVRVASVYVPNGQSVGADQYFYKLKFFDYLRKHLENLLSYGEMCVIGGDFNVAPTDNDVYDPTVWHEEVLCSTDERLAFKSLLNVGYRDALRLFHDGIGPFTWWDYRSGGFVNDKGLRIDHLLLSPLAADKVKNADVDRMPRGLEKPSDHAPVWCQLDV